MAQRVRLGLIGAGGFTASRMLPAFQKLPDVELTVVANRRRESAERIAAELGIPRVATDYREVIDSDDVDAVVIGAPPSVHRDAVLAALSNRKHVLCQTRIATTPDEAREMQSKADEVGVHGVRAMLVPPAPFYRGSRFVEHLVKSGY